LFAALLAGSGLVLIGAGSAAATTSVATEAELRAALANPATTGIVLANDIDLSDCTPSGGDLDRAGAITIDGAGFTVRQTCPGERVLESTFGTLTLENVTITGGDQTATSDPTSVLGGGVRAANDLVLDDTTVTGNTVSGNGPSVGTGAWGSGAFGGGVEADGVITVTGSHVDHNTARNAGSYGAGILGGAGQDVTITDSSVDRNTGEAADPTQEYGGANGGGVAIVTKHDSTSTILEVAGTVRVVRSSVSENVERPSATELAFAVGGGVFADTVVLEASHLDANELHPSATTDVAAGWGGGVFAKSSVTADRSTLDRNVVDPDGVREMAEWGAAAGQGVLDFTASSASNNHVVAEGASGFGECGGLLGATLTLTNSIVVGNQTSGSSFAIGGGVCAGIATVGASAISGNSVSSANGDASGGGAALDGGNFRDSTVSANSVGGTTAHGGGIVHQIFSSESVRDPLDITDSTITGNSASGTTSSSAGGLEQLQEPTLGKVGPLSIVFSTVAGNSAASGANVGNDGDTDPLTSFASTISDPLGGGASCAGITLTDQGYTQVTDTSCGTTAAADPRLAALADNGGPTETMLPADTSPLVGRVPPGVCTGTVTADQRGVTRPQGSACTVGAVEVAAPATPVNPPVNPPVTPPETPTATAPTAAVPVVARPDFTA
jgi:hypothetical protein